jgi:hypothetical protein
MTPAEKPNATDKNFVLVLFVSKESALPIPVDRPAKRVKENANITLESSISFLLEVNFIVRMVDNLNKK